MNLIEAIQARNLCPRTTLRYADVVMPVHVYFHSTSCYVQESWSSQVCRRRTSSCILEANPKSSNPNQDLMSHDDNPQHVTKQPPDYATINGVEFYRGKESYIMYSTNSGTMIGAFALEVLASILNQMSSPSKHYYALAGGMVSLTALALYTTGVVLWLNRPSPKKKSAGFFIDCLGMVCAIGECVCNIMMNTYFVMHVKDRIELWVLIVLFVACMGFLFFRFVKNLGRDEVSCDKKSLPRNENEA